MEGTDRKGRKLKERKEKEENGGTMQEEER